MSKKQNEWVRIFFSEGFKPHYCQQSLALSLTEDLGARDECQEDLESTVESVTGVCMDLPGMISVGRSYETLYIDGLIFEIPSQDFNTFNHLFQVAPLRKFDDGQEYYKVHSWISCIVVTPDQRLSILEQMDKLMPAAMRKGQNDDQMIENVKQELEQKGKLYRGEKKTLIIN